MTRAVLIYGILGGLLIVVLRFVEYRFLVIDHSVQIYGALIAALFAALGIWFGLTVTRKEQVVVVQEVRFPDRPFVRDDDRVRQLGITARELEILQLIADGMSAREIAEAVFVSENTVKTHSRHLFEKLGVKRRTKAVQVAREWRLIP